MPRPPGRGTVASGPTLYLTLVAPDYKPVPQDQISPTDPLPAEAPELLTPYGPKGAASSN